MQHMNAERDSFVSDESKMVIGRSMTLLIVPLSGRVRCAWTKSGSWHPS